MYTTDTGIVVFGITLYWYGLILVLSAWVGIEVATFLAEKRGLDQEHIWASLPWILIPAIIGARLWFILFPPVSVVANGRTAEWFFSHFFDLNQGAIAVWTGGLGLFGGLLGGLFGLIIYTRLNKLNVAEWLDIAAVVLPLAQTIGRLGNAVNQELYGPVTDLPWGILVTNETQRVTPYTDLKAFPLQEARFHPVFLYEALWTALIFSFLLILILRYRDRIRNGDLTLLYIILYASGRFLLEFVRVNPSLVGSINVSQMVALLAALVGIGLLIRRRQIPRENPRAL
jgi:phosphatidylglycerol---prolipoprotein diacylglyceryl transferase